MSGSGGYTGNFPIEYFYVQGPMRLEESLGRFHTIYIFVDGFNIYGGRGNVPAPRKLFPGYELPDPENLPTFRNGNESYRYFYNGAAFLDDPDVYTYWGNLFGDKYFLNYFWNVTTAQGYDEIVEVVKWFEANGQAPRKTVNYVANPSDATTYKIAGALGDWFLPADKWDGPKPPDFYWLNPNVIFTEQNIRLTNPFKFLSYSPMVDWINKYWPAYVAKQFPGLAPPVMAPSIGIGDLPKPITDSTNYPLWIGLPFVTALMKRFM